MNLFTIRLQQFLNDNPGCREVIVWGCGQLGDSVVALLREQFKQVNFCGFIDSSCHQASEINSSVLYPPRILLQLNPDLIIIASVAYEQEIFTSLGDEYNIDPNKIFSISRPQKLDEKIQVALSMQALDVLQQLVFMYPEQVSVWQALADITDDEQLKQDCHQCIKALGN